MTLRNQATGLLNLLLLGGISLALTGCQQDEPGRPLLHDKGTYQGKIDEQLSDEARDALRSRMDIQRGGGL